MSPVGPFEAPGVLSRTAPFLGAVGIGFATAPITDGANDYAYVLAASALLMALTAVTQVVPWTRLPRCAQAAPPLAFFAVVGLLRHGAGGAVSGYASLALLPILWFALHGSRGELLMGFIAMLVTLTAPIVLVGGAEYPTADWRRLITLVAVGALTCVAVQALVRDRTRLLAELAQLARTDQLTGAPNRRAWDEALDAAVAHVARTGHPTAVALVDLDRFKAYNDAHGHLAGDRLLKEATAAWTRQLRAPDMLARFGGEEFAVLLAGCDTDEARAALARMRRATPHGQTFSAGYTCIGSSDTPETVLARADAALYDAKRAGRDRSFAAA